MVEAAGIEPMQALTGAIFARLRETERKRKGVSPTKIPQPVNHADRLDPCY